MVASDPITYDRAELRDLLKAFKAMDDQAVQEARTESSALQPMQPIKSKSARWDDRSRVLVFGELPKESESASHLKSANSLMALHLKGFLVAALHKSSGQVLSLEVTAIASSPEELPIGDAAILATSSTRHFAKFSLN
jgi:hypothetical protein